MELSEQLAIETHNRLHWQDEADRLNRQVHALRRELAEARSHPLLESLRQLHQIAGEALPMVRYADLRWDPSRRAGLLAALEAALAQADALLREAGKTATHG